MKSNNKLSVAGIIATSITAISPLTLMLPTTASAGVSNIEQVTIYQGLASVTRSIKLDASLGDSGGEQVVVFSCLSPYLDVNSINIEASEGTNLGEVSIEDISGEQLQQCNFQDDNEVSRTQQHKLDTINAELDATKLALAYLQNLTKATQVSVDGSVGRNAKGMAKEATRLNTRMIELQKQQAKIQESLDKLAVGNSEVTTDSVKQLSIRTASRHDGEITLQYQVKGASWQPQYQARLNTDTQQLSITASAIIAQVTGENWSNIPLTLSPVNPNERTASWIPRPESFHLVDKPKIDYGSTPAPVIVMSESEEEYRQKPALAEPAPAPVTPLPSFNVSSANKNGLVTYKLPQRITIPSDGRQIQTVIGEQSGQTEIWLRSTPSRETNAYWYASAPFLTPAWANGSMQLYRDGSYIGQSEYAYQYLTEQGIGFGIDPNMIVKKLSEETKTGDSGRPKANKEPKTKFYTVNESYQFTSLHNRPVKLQVLGSEPISLDDNLQMSITHTPPVTEQNWNNKQGVVAWEFNMAPKQTQSAKTEYSLSYPGDKVLR